MRAVFDGSGRVAVLRRFGMWSRPVASRSGRAWTGVRVDAALGAAVLLGAVLRVREYAAGRSLWIDEARLALNVGARSYGELVGRLDYDQAAPPAFLWITKLATEALGMHEAALRLFVLVGGVLVLVGLALLAKRLLSPAEALAATTLAALSPALVRYSAELKQYGIDAGVAVLLVVLVVRTLRSFTRHEAVALAAVGAASVWLSMTAVLVLAGTAPAPVWSAVRHGRPPVRRLALVFGAWAVSFGTVYALSYSPAASTGYFETFWRYVILDPGHPDWLRGAWTAARDVLFGLFARTSIESLDRLFLLLAAVCVPLGVDRLRRRHGVAAAGAVAGPLVALLAASLAGAYPIALRLALFAAPLLILLLVAGAARLFDVVPSPGRVVPAIAASALVGLMGWNAVARFLDPPLEQHIRRAVAELRSRARPGDVVYVHVGAIPGWVFYTTDWAHPDTTRLALVAAVGTAPGLGFENAPSRGRPVGREGDSLAYRSASMLELFGVYTGIQWRYVTGRTGSAPDSGWAENEVRRIRATGARSFWTVASHDFTAPAHLHEALAGAGAVPDYEHVDESVRLVRYTW